MRIEGTDASSMTLPRLQNIKSEVRQSQEPAQPIKAVIENKSISQLTSFDKQELPISERVLVDAIERANKAIAGGNRKFEVSIHEKTNEIMVKVIDIETDKVIREIPPEKILDLVASMMEMAGLIVDERR